MKFTVIYSVPFFDLGVPSKFEVELTELTPSKVLAALNAYDADLAGLPVEECAGYTMLSFIKSDGEAVAVVRTNGLGPRDKDNCLCTAHFYVTHR